MVMNSIHKHVTNYFVLTSTQNICFYRYVDEIKPFTAPGNAQVLKGYSVGLHENYFSNKVVSTAIKTTRTMFDKNWFPKTFFVIYKAQKLRCFNMQFFRKL